jgi:uncharacterized protein (TIGR00299 family) protein
VKIVSFDSVGGASGDMLLGALIGLGADIKVLNEKLKTLLPNEEFEIRVEEVKCHGLSGIQAVVDIRKESHHHRRLNDIREIINSSALTSCVKNMSLKVFQKLADAEAKAHKTTPDKIHFHEVGAVDSILDIVGACLAMEMLGADGIALAPLPTGQGTFECQHGILPIPAPATAELLKGLDIVRTDEPYELVTPTGAALLSSWNMIDGTRGGKIQAVSNSFGQRELNNRPNLLRAMLIESEDEKNFDFCVLLETEIDDSSPELTGALFDKLMDCGALDVATSPVVMKKQRLGVRLSVLCGAEKKDAVMKMIFRESTTFGIRESLVKRRILQRRFVEMDTKYGKLKVKIGGLDGEDIVFSPEFDDCLRLAGENDVPVKEVFAEAARRGLKEV